MSGNSLLYIIVVILLNGCMTFGQTGTAGSRPVNPVRITHSIHDLRSKPFIIHPQPSAFTVCHGHTCRYFATIGLNTGEWAGIESIFSGKADTPEQERNHIRDAIALFEIMVGERVGTAGDLGENFAGLGRSGQMDCVDEATNTTVYLTMLQNAMLLHWHTVEHRISRGIMSLQVPHFTAVIRNSSSGLRYAVDSWFLDNGQPPFIILVDEWLAGWKP